MLTVDNIHKKFIKIDKHKKKYEIDANCGISFKVKDGTILGVLGPNGAGKTTLLRIIAGIITPTKGTVNYDDLNFINNEIEIKKNIAYLSGNTKIYNTLSAYELLKMCGEIYGLKKNSIDKKIKEVSKKLNMDTFLYNRISTLSTGQVQRVNIARCLIHDPKYYILDEATSGLDIISSQIILDFIKEEKEKGKIILYSTHYMEEAENICDYVVMINKGKTVKEGTPSKIKKETNTTNLRDAFFSIIGGIYNE